MSDQDLNAAVRGSELTDLLGPALEDAAYDCLSALAGVDTHDVNLRDHPEAWAAIEAFAAKVKRCVEFPFQGGGLTQCDMHDDESY